MSRARDIANYGDGIDTSSITSGTFADARIAVSNVTQHEGSIDALASNPTITLGSNTTFPAGISIQTFQSDKQQTNQIAGDQNAITCTLNTTAGTTSLKNSNSKLVIFFQANLVSRNTDSSAYLDAYLAGGNLGSTTSGIPVRLRWGEGFGDNANCGHGYAMAFDAPASTTPTYNMYMSTSSSSVNWQFYNAYFTFWEIKV